MERDLRKGVVKWGKQGVWTKGVYADGAWRKGRGRVAGRRGGRVMD